MRKGRLILWHAGKGWTWTLRASNGKLICCAPKSFFSKRNAVASADEAMQMFTKRNFEVSVVSA